VKQLGHASSHNVVFELARFARAHRDAFDLGTIGNALEHLLLSLLVFNFTAAL